MKPIQHLSLRKPQTWESGTHQRGRTDTYCNLRVTIIGHGNQNGLFDHIIQRISICTSVAIVQLDYNSTISGYFCSPSFSLHTERMQLRLSCYRALLVVSFAHLVMSQILIRDLRFFTFIDHSVLVLCKSSTNIYIYDNDNFRKHTSHNKIKEYGLLYLPVKWP